MLSKKDLPSAPMDRVPPSPARYLVAAMCMTIAIAYLWLSLLAS